MNLIHTVNVKKYEKRKQVTNEFMHQDTIVNFITHKTLDCGVYSASCRIVVTSEVREADGIGNGTNGSLMYLKCVIF